MKHWPARALLALLWLLHWLPLGVQAALGGALGRVFYTLARTRRRVAARNVMLCLPELSALQRRELLRRHFRWLGRSAVERALLWYASPARLKRLIHVEGDVKLAERSRRPVMWLVPHFLALDVAGVATQLFQSRPVVSIYQAQSHPVFDAAMRRGRSRFGRGALFARQDTVRPLLRAIRAGHAFFNLPDMDFGMKDAAFVPFFGVPAATLLAPSRMARALDMVVQPVVAQMLPGGRGWRVHFLPPWRDWPTGDPLADARRMNEWIEAMVRTDPAQYLWVHRRFKSRPEGEVDRYAARGPRR
ncbi:MAG TPA: lipid A biosynthesis acyltransferase [Rubrivivax sp.]|nr:lipid A biosynthesis acyltransferase [Rubrivivax sp.]